MKQSERFLKFDPRTKLLLLLELDVLLFLGRSLFYEAAVLLFCGIVVTIGGKPKTALKYLAVFGIMAAVQQIADTRTEQFIFFLLYFLCVCVRKLLPCLMLGKWLIETTPVSAYTAAMWKMKLPRSMIVTSSVIFRCFPTIREEWNAIRNAMKLRGIGINLRAMLCSPLKTMEYVFVPMFISVLNISDELAAAACCRGLDDPCQHTCMEPVRFRICDYIVIAAATGWLAAMCMLHLKGGSFP